MLALPLEHSARLRAGASRLSKMRISDRATEDALRWQTSTCARAFLSGRPSCFPSPERLDECVIRLASVLRSKTLYSRFCVTISYTRSSTAESNASTWAFGKKARLNPVLTSLRTSQRVSPPTSSAAHMYSSVSVRPP